MNEKSWNKFEKTGKISDYLNYKFLNENRVNAGEIKSAVPNEVEKKEKNSDFKKLCFSVNGGIGYADQDERHCP